VSGLYVFSIENGADNYPEIEPLYRTHYGEMQTRLASIGVPVKDYAPRLDIYFSYWRAGNLINYIVRKDGAPVGYSNIYLTSDMHNGELIASEDTIFLLPEHRNGTGRRLSKFILADLEARGVVRLNVQAVTDLRVAKLWKRMGFEHTAHAMTYTFKGKLNHVR
jgi:GNAT superfamily N-acetyltransferase